MRARRGLDKGFTLIEVLVSVAITSIVVAALFGSYSAATRAVTHAVPRLAAMSEAREALELIRREIEASTGGHDEPDRFIVKDRDLYGSPASEVSFVSALSIVPGPSRVSYYVVERKDGSRAVIKRIALPRSTRGADPEAEVIADIESFSVEALFGTAWQRTAIDGDLPDAVRVRLTVKIDGRAMPMQVTARPRAGRPL